jgi:ketosteroid isomerase-like protein
MKTSVVIFSFVIFFISSTLMYNTLFPQSRSHSEEELWNLEKTYMTLLKKGDIQELSQYWHRDFIGWPSHSPQPLDRIQSRASLEDLIGSMMISSFTFQPQAVRIINDVAIAHYTVTFEIQNTEGEITENSYRITHTWLKDKGTWKIIGGMSSKMDTF